MSEFPPAQQRDRGGQGEQVKQEAIGDQRSGKGGGRHDTAEHFADGQFQHAHATGNVGGGTNGLGDGDDGDEGEDGDRQTIRQEHPERQTGPQPIQHRKQEGQSGESW